MFSWIKNILRKNNGVPHKPEGFYFHGGEKFVASSGKGKSFSTQAGHPTDSGLSKKQVNKMIYVSRIPKSDIYKGNMKASDLNR
jgi:hypothetical protein